METLAGRMNWERTKDGVRIVLPFRLSLVHYSLMLWSLYLPLTAFNLLDNPQCPALIRGSRLLLGLSVCVFLGTWFLALYVRRAIEITPHNLRIAGWLLSRVLKEQSFATQRLYDLRINQMVSELTGKDVPNRNTVEINRGASEVTLARGLTDEEADALCTKLMEVYRFPAGLAENPGNGEGARAAFQRG